MGNEWANGIFACRSSRRLRPRVRDWSAARGVRNDAPASKSRLDRARAICYEPGSKQQWTLTLQWEFPILFVRSQSSLAALGCHPHFSKMEMVNGRFWPASSCI